MNRIVLEDLTELQLRTIWDWYRDRPERGRLRADIPTGGGCGNVAIVGDLPTVVSDLHALLAPTQ